MKQLCAVLTAIALATLSTASSAAEPLNVNGTWVGVVKLPNGQQVPFIAHLKQQGESVTGVLDGINGAPDVPIQSGSIADGKLTFTGVRSINNQDVTFTYTATPTADGGLHFAIARAGAAPVEAMSRHLTDLP